MKLPPSLRTGDSREDRRREIAFGVLDAISRPGGDKLSFRALANEAGVSRPTLRHHFGDEEGVIRTALELASELGTTYTDQIAQAEGEPGACLREHLGRYAQAWADDYLTGLHRVGMRAGLRQPSLGQTYADRLLGKSIGAFATLLSRWHADGVLVVDDPHASALSLVGPVHLLLMVRYSFESEESLGGVAVDALIEHQVRGFLETHGS